jgi:hypothetical protein
MIESGALFVISPKARVITCILAQFIAIAFIAVTAGTRNQSSNYPIDRVRTSAKNVAYFGSRQQALGNLRMREGSKVHARRGETAEEVLENRRGRLLGTVVWPYVRQACRCAEFGSLFRHISISLPFVGVPGEPGSPGWETASGERREFFEFSNMR